MTDRELLQRAAKAMWHGEIDDVVSIRWGDLDGSILYTHADNQDHNGIDREYRWNPLEENHDAFELAVKLGLILNLSPREDCRGQTVVTYSGLCKIEEPCYEGRDVAARRAIVRAAAALGEQP